MSKTTTKHKGARTPRRAAKDVIKDPVEVYLRLKTLDASEDSCVAVIDHSTIRIKPPEFSRNTAKESEYCFKTVFGETCSQRKLFDIVCFPLISDLLTGKNGLLFTYGCTGSGKTYTMTGQECQPGLLPRTLAVIFNSIQLCHAKKYQFKPDRLNFFDVQSDADAMIDRSKEMTNRTSPVWESDPDLAEMSFVRDSNSVDVDFERLVFAVFISYVEIYNNYTYDLLDANSSQTPKSKTMREDALGNVYVAGVSEVEVRSPEEALRQMQRGVKRRRVAATQLNRESSRSHTIFTIRVVQAPYCREAQEVFESKSGLVVSQLCLVDLAGSERCARTQNQGDRLREAGNINSSLSVLKRCLEVLRENQATGQCRVVPYRDCKLTQLFKGYFDVEGKVRMVVCINSRCVDYDETIRVMEFAEMTQEVQVKRSEVRKHGDMGNFTPSKKRAFEVHKKIVKRLSDQQEGICLPLIYDFPPFPVLDISSDPDDEASFRRLERFLRERIDLRSRFVNDLDTRWKDFRNDLVNMDTENDRLRDRVEELQLELRSKDKNRLMLEKRLRHVEKKLEAVMRNQEEHEKAKRDFMGKQTDLEQRLRKEKCENVRLKDNIKSTAVNEKDRLEREYDRILKEREAEMAQTMWERDHKLAQMRKLLEGEEELEVPLSSDTPITSLSPPFSAAGDTYTPSSEVARKRGMFEKLAASSTPPTSSRLGFATDRPDGDQDLPPDPAAPGTRGPAR